jgi:hypothetical protein
MKDYGVEVGQYIAFLEANWAGLLLEETQMTGLTNNLRIAETKVRSASETFQQARARAEVFDLKSEFQIRASVGSVLGITYSAFSGAHLRDSKD